MPPPSESVSTSSTWVAAVSQLLIAAMWPTVVAFFLWFQRKPIHSLLCSLSDLAKSANKIKFWQLEIERKVDDVLSSSAQQAQSGSLESKDIPLSSLEAAERVKTLVSTAPTADVKHDLTEGIRQKLLELAAKYDALRVQMPSSEQRTRRMNELVAQMRALGRAGRPFLNEFCAHHESAGVRLAAITILQVMPDTSYTEWLVGRMSEQQAFLIFHASLALLAMVRSDGRQQFETLTSAIDRSIKVIESFPGLPDQNSLAVLANAKQELELSRLQG